MAKYWVMEEDSGVGYPTLELAIIGLQNALDRRAILLAEGWLLKRYPVRLVVIK